MSEQVRIALTATDNASRVLAQVRSGMDGLQSSAAKLGPLLSSLGVSFSAGAATVFFRSIVNGLDALNDLRDATGASIESISALEDVAARTGTSFDTVGSALVKFNKVLAEAAPGSNAELAFRGLGLSLASLKQQDPAEALRRTAVALSGFADDANKARLIQELFGKSIREVAPFLADLATQTQLIGKVTTEQAAAAEKFNQQLSTLAKNSQDAARELTSALLPALNRSLEIFTKLQQQGLFGTGVVGVLKGQITDSPGQDINALIAKRTELEKRLAEQQRLRRETGFKGQDQVSERLQKELFQIEDLLQVSRVRQLASIEGLDKEYSDAVSRRFQRTKPSLAPLPTKSDKAAAGPTEAARYLENLQKQLEKTQELSVLEQVLIDLQKQRIDKVTPQQAEQIKAVAAQIDAANAATKAEKDRAKAQEEVARAYERSVEAARAYIAAIVAENEQHAQRNQQMAEVLEEMGLESAALDRLRIARIDANIALQEEALLNAQRERAGDAEIAQIERRIELLREQRRLSAATAARRAQIEEDDANRQRTKALTESISDGILNGFRQGSTFADIFIAELKAQFAKTVLQPTIQPIVEAGNALISGALKSLLSFDGGGYTGPGARAGGIDGRGGFLGVLHPNETVLDHSKGQGTGAIVININQTVGDLVTGQRLQQNNRDLVRRIQSGLASSLTRGGALA